MTYRRAFRVGELVKIGEHLGTVDQIRLLVTHLRTKKNEEVIIPNSSILAGEVINDSSIAKARGSILHTTVGIRYDVPWRQVEAMLLEAAAMTEGLRRDPSPFVLQMELGDFCVTYEINVFCDKPHSMLAFKTALQRIFSMSSTSSEYRSWCRPMRATRINRRSFQRNSGMRLPRGMMCPRIGHRNKARTYDGVGRCCTVQISHCAPPIAICLKFAGKLPSHSPERFQHSVVPGFTRCTRGFGGYGHFGERIPHSPLYAAK